MASTQNKYSYIPPSVQKSMAAHMERTMPAHLKKFQDSGARMPVRIEKEMTAQMQKNLPSHMQQYVEPYMQQNVIYGNNNTSQKPQIRQDAPASQAYKPVQTQVILPNKPEDQRSLRDTASTQSSTTPYSQPTNNSSANGEYEFILNPAQPPKKPLFDLSGGGKLKKGLILGAGLIVLIILFSVVSSFLNSAGNAQKEKLLAVAQTQQEILRVNEAALEKIGDRNLLFRANSVKQVITSSQQDIISALANRGLKKVDKQLAGGVNSQNDAILVEGEQNGNFDKAYRALLNQELNNYGLQLQAAYDGSTASEQQSIETAFSQLELLVDEPTTEP